MSRSSFWGGDVAWYEAGEGARADGCLTTVTTGEAKQLGCLPKCLFDLAPIFDEYDQARRESEAKTGLEADRKLLALDVLGKPRACERWARYVPAIPPSQVMLLDQMERAELSRQRDQARERKWDLRIASVGLLIALASLGSNTQDSLVFKVFPWAWPCSVAAITAIQGVVCGVFATVVGWFLHKRFTDRDRHVGRNGSLDPRSQSKW